MLRGIFLHSFRSEKGEPTERWGRKATGLRDTSYDSGVATMTNSTPEIGCRHSSRVFCARPFSFQLG